MRFIFLGILLLVSSTSLAKSNQPNRKVASDSINLVSFVGNQVTDSQISFRSMNLDAQMKFKPVLDKMTDIYSQIQAGLYAGKDIGAFTCSDVLNTAYNSTVFSKKINSLLSKQDILESDKKSLMLLLGQSEKNVNTRNAEFLSCLKNQVKSDAGSEKIDLNSLQNEFELLKNSK